jgi:zinc protease
VKHTEFTGKRVRRAARSTWHRSAVLVTLLAAAPLIPPNDIVAQQPATSPFDRTVIPAPGKTPALRVPTWTATTLSNGAQLVVSERHNLPLVSFNITFVGGSNQYETAGKDGVASFTAAMLSEGTTTKSGDELSNALQLLGSSVGAGVGDESGSIGFVSTTAKFPQVLAILEDMLVNPLLPADALERLRARTLVSLTQAKDQTGAIAGRVFPKVLYTEAHPYGRAITEKSVKAITRGDIVAFHKAYFTPGHALITVVGDVDAAAVRRTVEQVLAPWPSGGSVPSFAYPAIAAPATTTIYLVDRPGAAQSSFAIGIPGPARDTPDFFALQVLNTILGGQFQSRLNANLREQKGYSYSVSSGFSFGKGPGPFEAGGDVVTAKSDSALIEFMKELRGIRGGRPITDEELQTAKELLVQRLPQNFASVSSVNGSIVNIYLNALPQDYYQRYADRVAAVTREELIRVANKYLDVDHLAIVIVGDRKEIEEALRKTGVAPIVVLDLEGDPIK